MELLTTVGEQVGCLVALARQADAAQEGFRHAQLVISSRQ
jgi:hypothetical protein